LSNEEDHDELVLIIRDFVVLLKFRFSKELEEVERNGLQREDSLNNEKLQSSSCQ